MSQSQTLSQVFQNGQGSQQGTSSNNLKTAYERFIADLTCRNNAEDEDQGVSINIEALAKEAHIKTVRLSKNQV